MPARSQLVLLAALAGIVLFSLASDRIDPYVLRLMILCGVNIILAVSLNLVNGFTGQFSLGHAGFMSVGAYASAAITMKYDPSGATIGFAAGALFFAALIAGGLIAAVVGLFVGMPSLRLRGDYLAIVTLGFGEIIRVILINIPSLGGALGLNGIPPFTNFFWTYLFAAATIYAVFAIIHSTYGRGFIAVQDDEVAAEAMGINTTGYKITAFVVGAFFAGIAGGIYAHVVRSIDPSGFNFIKSIEIVVMVILGGMGNTPGVVLAAILLTLLPEGLRWISESGLVLPLPFLPESWRNLHWVNDTRMIIYSLILIILMLARPQGLFRFRKGVQIGGQ
jgi:branched-chain amino acid transport system permease protein